MIEKMVSKSFVMRILYEVNQVYVFGNRLFSLGNRCQSYASSYSAYSAYSAYFAYSKYS